MRTFTKEQIDEYLKFLDNDILNLDEFIGQCVVCGKLLSESNLPDGPEKEVVCLKDREYFVEEYSELIRSGQFIDTNTNGLVIKTDEEIRKEKLTSKKIEGLSVGEVILLDWINFKKAEYIKPNYFEKSYGIDVSDSIDTLQEQKYIRLGSPSESIYSFSNIELKEILENFKLKKSGTKSELIQRIKKELNVKNIKTYIRPTWVVTDKGKDFLKKYNIIIWAHKIDSNRGYHVGVTPFSILPYLSSTNDNETIAITVCQDIINQNLMSGEVLPDIVSSSIFQSEMYGILKNDQKQLESLLLGMMFLVTGVFSRVSSNNWKINYIGFPMYKHFKSQLTKFKYHISRGYIDTLAKSIYMKYEKFLPENKLCDTLDDFVNAIIITVYETEKEWDTLSENWINKK
ncbi:MAG: SAP domain-containing protein [Lactococcus sp.]|nr:SAP domain-containing protein [Lactococcus sp.]MDN5412332.1 SAP domain-containing protein [Lactococcus sp.]MDN5464611.1 SAP domain-containing protein [Lactococcus lactis]